MEETAHTSCVEQSRWIGPAFDLHVSLQGSSSLLVGFAPLGGTRLREP